MGQLIHEWREWVWKLAVFSWVSAPIFGFWKYVHPRISQFGWWVLASAIVLAVSFLVERKRKSEVFNWFLLVGVIAYFCHLSNFNLGFSWLLRLAVICAAAQAISERTDFEWIGKCVEVCAFAQIPIVVLQGLNVPLGWPVSGGGIQGTLYRRGGFSVLMGAVSIWSNGRRAWFFSGLALLSGSMAGFLPSIARLVWKLGWKVRIAAGVAAVGLAILLFPQLMIRAGTRFESWSNLVFLKDGWLTGAGFLPLPGAFGEDMHFGAQVSSAVVSDYHSTFLDWIGRFGLIGVLTILPILVWIFRETFRRKEEWMIWTLILALVAGFVQSAEGFAVMGLLGMLWWMHLEENSYVPSV